MIPMISLKKNKNDNNELTYWIKYDTSELTCRNKLKTLCVDEINFGLCNSTIEYTHNINVLES